MALQNNNVKTELKSGKLQLGVNYGQLHSVEIVRLLAAAGFHWTFIDAEHGTFGLELIGDICRVSRLAGLCPIVRVADLNYGLTARALDCGAQGIIFPRMEDPRLLETAISWTRFPPAGIRGYGLQPSQLNYEAVKIPDAIEHINAHTLTVLQIESERGVDAREELLSVPGIDAVMIGPADLSISLGVPGEFQHPKMVAAMEAVRDTCDAHGIAPGTQTRTVALARFWKEHGMRFLGCGSDISFLFERAKETAAAVLAD